MFEAGRVIENAEGYVIKLISLIKYTAGETEVQEHWEAQVVNQGGRKITYVHGFDY